MISRKARSPNEVTISAIVTNVRGSPPTIRFSFANHVRRQDAVAQFPKEHNGSPRVKICKAESTSTVPGQIAAVRNPRIAAVLQQLSPSLPPPLDSSKGAPLQRSATGSSVSRLLMDFRKREQDDIKASSEEDVYSINYVPKKYEKYGAEYGTPKPGTLTAKRAAKASRHIAREMLQLCEVIQEYGKESKREPHNIVITFGRIFQVYQFISDKVVGILLRARKHGMVDFEGEMLFQRRDEETVITLLWSHDQIQSAIEKLKDGATLE